jgi:hypothetical protein
MANNESHAQEPVKVTGELTRLQAENAALRSRLQRRARVRLWLSSVLVILSALLVVASTVAVWTYRTAFDTDRFMATVEPALEDPAFYSALGNTVSEQTLDALDLETRVTNRLTQLDEYISQVLVDAVDIDPQARELISRFDRPSLAALAPPITSALEDRIDQVVDRFISSEEFRSRFPNLVRQVHEASVALVRNDLAELPNVYLTEGEVRLNLIPIIRDALSRVIDEIREFLPDVDLPEVISDRIEDGRQQLGDALQAELPPDFGQVTLMSADALGDVQQTVHRLDQFVWLLLLLTVVVIAITIAVSPARRRTVVQLGVGTVVGLVLGAVIIRRLQAAVLEEVRTPDGERAVRALLTETMGSLRAVALVVGAVALVGAVVAYVVGKPAWIGRLSERASDLVASSPRGSKLDRWVAGHYDLLRIAGIAVAVAIIFVTGVEIIPVLIVGGLLALFLWSISASNSRAGLREPIPEPESPTPAPRT